MGCKSVMGSMRDWGLDLVTGCMWMLALVLMWVWKWGLWYSLKWGLDLGNTCVLGWELHLLLKSERHVKSWRVQISGAHVTVARERS